VGTALAVSKDVPALDIAYKLTAYAGRGRTKLSPGKRILPGRKQIFRVEEEGRAVRDILARHDEVLPGRPLLRQVMAGGSRLPAGEDDLRRARARARAEIALLPERVQDIAPAAPPYPVQVSAALEADLAEATRRYGPPAAPES
jgi:nicotinate phosphoribosyltransferase